MTTQTFDWPSIRALYQSGRTSYGISKLPGMPSRPAIDKRADKEGWKRDATTKVAQVAHPELVPARGDFTEKQRQVLAVLGEGGTLQLAAAAAGVGRQTVYDWQADKPAFKAACDAAKAAHRLKLVKRIDDASERDWKAGAWRLERDPETREDFAPPSAKHGGNTLQIVLNIDRGQPGESTPATVIEYPAPTQLPRQPE